MYCRPTIHGDSVEGRERIHAMTGAQADMLNHSQALNYVSACSSHWLSQSHFVFSIHLFSDHFLLTHADTPGLLAHLQLTQCLTSVSTECVCQSHKQNPSISWIYSLCGLDRVPRGLDLPFTQLSHFRAKFKAITISVS